MSVRLATRNLLQSRPRFAMSVGGIALAAVLVLVLDGVFAGSQRQVTAYMDNVDFDVVVAQEGVRNLHMTTSFIPEQIVERVEAVSGVADAEPLLYTTTFLVSGSDRGIAYLIGYLPEGFGGPWERVSGRIPPEPGEVVIDELLAERWGLSIGETLRIAGRRFRVGGLTAGTVNVVNSITFVRYSDFQAATGVRGVVSYVLVRGEPGVSPDRLADDLREEIDDVTVLTREQFAESERGIIGDMSVDIMRIMNVFGFLIGLAVVGLTVYTSTYSRLREYGVLKALGARSWQLYGVVLRQAAMSVGVGMAVGVGVSLAVAAALPALGSAFSVALTADSLFRVGVAGVVIGLLTSAVPIARIARLSPAEVFRR